MFSKKYVLKYLVVVFGSVAAVAFQSVFYLEMQCFFLKKKIIFDIRASK
jgi:hypothetical protein